VCHVCHVCHVRRSHTDSYEQFPRFLHTYVATCTRAALKAAGVLHRSISIRSCAAWQGKENSMPSQLFVFYYPQTSGLHLEQKPVGDSLTKIPSPPSPGYCLVRLETPTSANFVPSIPRVYQDMLLWYLKQYGNAPIGWARSTTIHCKYFGDVNYKWVPLVKSTQECGNFRG